jgi:hypothetical protein
MVHDSPLRRTLAMRMVVDPSQGIIARRASQQRLGLIAAGLRFGTVLADAGYGLSAPFRKGLRVLSELGH